MPAERSLDIDTPWDMQLARLLMTPDAETGVTAAFSPLSTR